MDQAAATRPTRFISRLALVRANDQAKVTRAHWLEKKRVAKMFFFAKFNQEENS